MMSVSQVTASAFSGSQELVAALAHLNFDISLIMVAENGSLHVTARKLGSLFGPLILDTPKLVEVYGKRASEIARSPVFNPQATYNESIFAEYIGADGTSIWAAATSGVYSIAMHLLATMLSRMWTASEATSIWVEIVAARKKQLLETVDHKVDLTTVLAAQIVLERESLAEWDNSARAWLRRADEAKKREQTQLMLILNNLSIDIPRKLSTYSSVIDALRNALRTMEDLVSGIPLGVDEGSVLLALSCWHIYPDMLVMGNKTIKQNDPLVPKAGRLTLGLENGPSRKDQGVYWCLSLTHMKFYGAPVTSESSLTTSSGRLSSDQLMCVTLGAVLHSWNYKTVNLTEVCKVLIALYQNMSRATARASKCSLGSSLEKSALRELDESWKADFQTKPNWIKSLAEAAKDLALAKGLERDLGMKLVSLGQERGSSFLAEAALSPSPVSGLSEFENILPLMERDEDRIALLRKYALQFFPDATASDIIIRYRVDGDRKFTPATAAVSQDIENHTHDPKGFGNKTILSTDESNAPIPIPTFSFYTSDDKDSAASMYSEKMPANHQAVTAYEYATGLPFKLFWSSLSTLHYGRWIYSEHTPMPSCKSSLFSQQSKVEEVIKSMPLKTVAPETILSDVGADLAEKLSLLDVPRASQEQSMTSVLDESTEGKKEGKSDPLLSSPSFPENTWNLRAENYEFQVSSIDDDKFFQQVPDIQHYTLFLGDPDVAAIYVRPSVLAAYEELSRNAHWPYKKVIRPKRIQLDDVIEILNKDAISSQAFDCYMRNISSNSYYQLLRLLSFIQEIYKPLSKATIDSNIILKPLYSRPWANVQSTRSYFGQPFSRNQTFACIAMLETGTVDLPISSFTNVFALSSANSVFVAAPLICDPSELCLPYEIRHIVGNIGKPGLTLLVPPSDPEVFKPSADNWHMINRLPYDGELVDSFKDTSLHLNISGSQLPIDLGDKYRGRCDIEASLVEAFVSVHNRGKWIADLDILTALGRGHSQPDHVFYYKPVCEHVRAHALHMAATAAKSEDVQIPKTRKQSKEVDDIPDQKNPDNNDTEEDDVPEEREDFKNSMQEDSSEDIGEDLNNNNSDQNDTAKTILGADEFRYTSIDSWEEFLSPPDGPSVVRAHGNWLARISTTVLAVQQQNRVLLNERPCFFCVKNIDQVGGSIYTDKVIFIS